MEIAFASINLRGLCENEAEAKRDLGERAASKLKRRLADIRAATCMTDLIVGRPHLENGSKVPSYSIELDKKIRIFFCINHQAVPLLASGDVDLSQVSRIKITKVENSHVKE